ncbi:MAG: HyaD/HybD family hydrogenase maturation endopeptidase [Thermodesulfobacteriota bacterium]
MEDSAGNKARGCPATGQPLNVLVLGVGNVLLSDEGAGVRVIERLRKTHRFPGQVELLDGGTMGLELLPWLEERSHLFIVDAIRSDNPPGSVMVRQLDDPPAFFRQKISPHQIGLSELLAVASLQNCLPGSVTLFGITPADLSTGIELSPEGEAAVGRACNEVVAALATLGSHAESITG